MDGLGGTAGKFISSLPDTHINSPHLFFLFSLPRSLTHACTYSAHWSPIFLRTHIHLNLSFLLSRLFRLFSIPPLTFLPPLLGNFALDVDPGGGEVGEEEEATAVAVASCIFRDAIWALAASSCSYRALSSTSSEMNCTERATRSCRTVFS